MRHVVYRVFFLLLVPSLALAGAAFFYMSGGRYVSTENAYVKARLIGISADIDGRVLEVPATNNQSVEAGQVLFRLDPTTADINIAAARADLVNVRQRIESSRAHYQQGKLEVEAVHERIRFLTRQFQRQEKLKSDRLGTEVSFDQAQHELEMAHRNLGVARQRNAVVLAELGGDTNVPLEAHASHLKAEAVLAEALRELEHTVVRAPAAGVLSNMTLEPGEYVEAGKSVFALVETADTWIEANLKESQLTHVKVGQRARVVIDAYPDRELEASVESLSPATGSEFALLPPQNATGNWVKVVQRLPVRLRIDRQAGVPQLRAGMTATVSIDTEHEREIPLIMKSVLASVLNRP